jgi:hypothetical protein
MNFLSYIFYFLIFRFFGGLSDFLLLDFFLLQIFLLTYRFSLDYWIFAFAYFMDLYFYLRLFSVENLTLGIFLWIIYFRLLTLDFSTVRFLSQNILPKNFCYWISTLAFCTRFSRLFLWTSCRRFSSVGFLVVYFLL